MRRTNFGVMALAALVTVPACGRLVKETKVEQYAAPDVDATRFKRVTVIAAGTGKYELQIMGRVREQLTASGVTVLKRAGSWSDENEATKAICVKGPNLSENVDGVIFVRWDRLTLHDCESGKVATDINGGYNGTEKMTEHLLRYLGARGTATK